MNYAKLREIFKIRSFFFNKTLQILKFTVFSMFDDYFNGFGFYSAFKCFEDLFEAENLCYHWLWVDQALAEKTQGGLE